MRGITEYTLFFPEQIKCISFGGLIDFLLFCNAKNLNHDEENSIPYADGGHMGLCIGSDKESVGTRRLVFNVYRHHSSQLRFVLSQRPERRDGGGADLVEPLHEGQGLHA